MSTHAADHNRAVYEQLKPGMDDYWRKMAAPRFRVRTLVDELRRIRPDSLVDLGCGNGALLQDIHRSLPGVRLAGMDIAASQIALNASAMPWASFHVADLSRPLPDGVGTYGAAISSEVIEHLDRPQALLESARELVRPGGHLLLTTQSGPVRETERRVGHVRHFERGELEAMLGQAGFEVLKVWNAGFPFHDLSKWYANLDPDASMARFGDRRYGLREDLVCAGLRLAFRMNSRRRGAQLFAVARRP